MGVPNVQMNMEKLKMPPLIALSLSFSLSVSTPFEVAARVNCGAHAAYA